MPEPPPNGEEEAPNPPVVPAPPAPNKPPPVLVLDAPKAGFEAPPKLNEFEVALLAPKALVLLLLAPKPVLVAPKPVLGLAFAVLPKSPPPVVLEPKGLGLAALLPKREGVAVLVAPKPVPILVSLNLSKFNYNFGKARGVG